MRILRKLSTTPVHKEMQIKSWQRWKKEWKSSLQSVAAAAAKSLQSCPTERPHRRQPTRLCCPWDSPGKNTGVGCHFLLQRMTVKSERDVAQSCPTLRDCMNYSLPGSSVHWIFQARVLDWGAIAFSSRVLLGMWKMIIHRFQAAAQPPWLPKLPLS